MKYGFEWSFSFFRSVLFIAPSIVLATAFWGFLSLLVSYFDSGGRKQAWMARQWARTLLFVSGTRVTVRGLEKLAPGQNYIFVSNHRSYMDTPVVLASIPVAFRFMAKAGLFKIPLLGGHLERAGHIPVPLDKPREAVRSMTEAGRVIAERRISVLVFPEGGRTMGEMGEFREGAAFIAIKGGVPIVPVGLTGTFELLPMHSVHVRPRRVVVSIGEPISTAGIDIKERAALTARLRDEVAHLILNA
ncbi:MAG: lysophospholipid acyltransferase family protein [Bryobacteraceae bacterium]|nr:lysophospholipid acyltransferase family protein [Bryobacteraceae bacterium]